MHKIEKKFTFPMGHRLSKHDGRCFNIHGHNFTILVGVKCRSLDDNNMVIDFYNLKKIVEPILDFYDHSLMLNECDFEQYGKPLSDLGMRINLVPNGDPTAELLSKVIYEQIQKELNKDRPWVLMDYVTVFENENSKATYCEE
jgi:6-pyruvoyltetrahydropterin/6-carboxytetrahydropterin synthase